MDFYWILRRFGVDRLCFAAANSKNFDCPVFELRFPETHLPTRIDTHRSVVCADPADCIDFIVYASHIVLAVDHASNSLGR